YFFFNDTATTEIYTTTDTLSLHDALPILACAPLAVYVVPNVHAHLSAFSERSEEHTSELQSPVVISYDVLCLKKKNKTIHKPTSMFEIQQKQKTNQTATS